MMECPHCQKEIPGKACPHCHGLVPTEGHFCMHCGEPFESDRESGLDQENDFDLEDRILCPDGTCTGIIIDGKCSECGKPYQKTESQET